MADIHEKDEQRLAFLHRLYELVEGVTRRMITDSTVSARLGFDPDTTDRLVDFVDEYLIERRAFGGMIGITPLGVAEVEEALRGPRDGTQHFPFQVINNVLIVERIEGSQIQIGTTGSTQMMQTANLDEVRGLVSQLRAAIGELEFVDEAVTASVAEDLDSVERQLNRENPPRAVARELLTSARHTLEGAAGGVVAEHADKVGNALELFDRVITSLSQSTGTRAEPVAAHDATAISALPISPLDRLSAPASSQKVCRDGV